MSVSERGKQKKKNDRNKTNDSLFSFHTPQPVSESILQKILVAVFAFGCR